MIVLLDSGFKSYIYEFTRKKAPPINTRNMTMKLKGRILNIHFHMLLSFVSVF
jgi:hypothetical protein